MRKLTIRRPDKQWTVLSVHLALRFDKLDICFMTFIALALLNYSNFFFFVNSAIYGGQIKQWWV